MILETIFLMEEKYSIRVLFIQDLCPSINISPGVTPFSRSREILCSAACSPAPEGNMPMGKIRFAAFGNSRVTRLATYLGVAFALLIGVGVVAATPAMAAVTVTTTTIEHVCEQFGTDDWGNQAIVCTDLEQQAYSSSAGLLGYDVAARTEALCENSADAVVQCANITVANEAAAPDGEIGPVYNAACGHAHGNCPVGRYYVVGDTLLGQPEDCVGEVWAVTLAGPGTSIELPTSGETFDLPANFGTPHATVGSC
jgi:hypothetical protein